MRARITKFYSAGHRRPAAGAAHRFDGDLTVMRYEGRYGLVPVLSLDWGADKPALLFEPRLVDLIAFNLVVGGLERAVDGAWVAQEWWVDLIACV